MPTGPRRRLTRSQRALRAARVSEEHAGVAHRRDLRAAGVSRADVRSEVDAGGRVYLDVVWEDVGLVVEIDGGHHALALNVVDDALRQNEVVLGDERVLRVPVMGLRLVPQLFMAQVVRAHAGARLRAA